MKINQQTFKSQNQGRIKGRAYATEAVAYGELPINDEKRNVFLISEIARTVF